MSAPDQGGGASGPGQGQAPPEGPPYASRIAQLGGTPTVSVDVPISSVVIALFIAAAAFHMTMLQRNRRRGHKFLFSGMLFGLCMARIVANSLRIALAVHDSNVSLAIAANIFANLGVILLFVVNLVLSQRILRAFHPRFGWSLLGTWPFRLLLAGCVAVVVMVVVAIPYSSYTLDRDELLMLRDVQLTAITYLNVVAFLPVLVTLLSTAVPHAKPIDRFGHRSMRTKVVLVVFTATLLTFGACVRTAGVYLSRPVENPAWYHSRPVYYCVLYLIELICVYTYGLARFDQRFWIPNGSSAPGHYSAGTSSSDKFASTLAAPAATSSAAAARFPPTRGFWAKEAPTDEERRLWEQAWESQLQIELDRRGSTRTDARQQPTSQAAPKPPGLVVPSLQIPQAPDAALLSPDSANRRPSHSTLVSPQESSMSPRSARSFGW